MKALFYTLLAQTNPAGSGKISAGDIGLPNAADNTGESLLQNSLNLFYFITGAVAVIMIIVAGVFYVISSGDSGKVARAKNMITYAVVGLVVILAAFGITNFVIGAFN